MRLACVVILVGMVVYQTPAPAQQKPQDVRQWIQLFNGRDLADWTIKFSKHDLGENFRNTFRVADGLLQVRYDQWPSFNGEFGHIFYKDPFSYYLLAAEYRFVGEQVTGALAKRTLWAMAGISFLAIYRELFEVILFYETLWAQAGPAQQPAVLGLSDRTFNQACLTQIDLIGEVQAARVGHRPNRAARSGQRCDDLVQHRVVELGRRDVAPRQLGDLLYQSLDLAFGALDLVRVHGGSGSLRGW